MSQDLEVTAAKVVLQRCSGGRQLPRPDQKVDADVVLDQISKTKGAATSKCFAMEADLSILEGPRHLIDEVVRLTRSKTDILVNKAGIAHMRPLQDVALDQWDSQLNRRNGAGHSSCSSSSGTRQPNHQGQQRRRSTRIY